MHVGSSNGLAADFDTRSPPKKKETDRQECPVLKKYPVRPALPSPVLVHEDLDLMPIFINLHSYGRKC